MFYRGASRTAHPLRLNRSVLALIGILLSAYATVTRGVERRILHKPSDVFYLAKSAWPSQGDKESRKLELGKPIERYIPGDLLHNYEFTLAAGECIDILIEQLSVDVVVTAFGPSGDRLTSAARGTGRDGPETIWLLADTSGAYRLELYAAPGYGRNPNSGKSENTGRYRIVIREMYQATAQDRTRFLGVRAYRAAEGFEVHDAGRTEERLRKARDKYLEASSLYRAAGDGKNEGLALHQAGWMCYFLGDSQEAFDYLSQAMIASRAANDGIGEGESLLDIGLVYKAQAEPQKALDYFYQSLVIFQKHGIRNLEVASLDNIGVVYLELGDPKRALSYFNRALLVERSYGGLEARMLKNIGKAYRHLGENQKALAHLKKALDLYHNADQMRGESITRIALGDVYADLGLRLKAIEHLALALQFFRAAGERPIEASILIALGQIDSDAAESQNGLNQLNEALLICRALGDRNGEAVALFNIARNYGRSGDLDTARRKIESAIGIIETVRSKVISQELRASYIASVRNYYEFYIDVLMQLDKRKPAARYNALALQASENARARSLLELLTEARADIRQGVEPVLLDHERTLQQLLTAKTERLMLLRSNSTSKGRTQALAKDISSIEREIEALMSENQELQAQIRIKSPRYASLTQPQPLSLKEIQQLLDSDTLLLEYALGKERSFLWAVTSTTLQSFELPKRADVEASAARVYQLLTARSRRLSGETSKARQLRIAQADATYPKAATALSEMILKDVSPQLGIKRLVIVGDGVLQYIPFAVLPDPASLDGERAVHSPLLINHEIVNLPSASTLAVVRQHLSGRRAAAKSVAILADPVFDKDDVRVKTTGAGPKTVVQSTSVKRNAVSRDIERMEDLNGNSRFPPLRLAAAHWEAKEIGKLVPATERMQALDFAANRQTATSPELSQYRIVHFATHAFNNSAHPELSGIVLSLVNERGEPQDGFLRLGEIFNLNLPVELVVLSGCQTGLGKEVKGEGLIGMTRGFMYAGAPRLVVSLWSVDDRATSAFMARFYKRMLGKQKQPPAAALRAAQIEMWKESGWKSPYFWAGFVFQGEWKQIGAN